MTYGKVKNTAELTTCFTIQLLIGSLGNISGAASATDFFKSYFLASPPHTNVSILSIFMSNLKKMSTFCLKYQTAKLSFNLFLFTLDKEAR